MIGSLDSRIATLQFPKTEVFKAILVVAQKMKGY
jgi:hypothetical protein